MATLAMATLTTACSTHQVRDCEGNHLSFPIPPIELLEHMLQHPEKRPIHKLLAPCLACLQQVHEELRVLCSKQLQHPSIARFPQLQATIRDGLLYPYPYPHP